MRVAVVAGPDPGTRFRRSRCAGGSWRPGDTPTLLTGTEWLDTARAAGVDAVELAGLDPTADDDDGDAGAKIHQRAARMAVLNLPQLQAMGLDLVVSDVITACGGMSAELLGIPWIELNPHPLYRPSEGLPPIGSGLAPGTGIRGRLRDATMRALTARSLRAGDRQRAQARAEIGLPASDPGPLRMLIATLPALEVPRPDWPAEAVLVGPLHFEPTEQVLSIPSGSGPVVVVAPSTATTGTKGMAETALDSLVPGVGLPRRRAAGGVAAERSGADVAVVGGGRAGPAGRSARPGRSGDLRRWTRHGGQDAAGGRAAGGGSRRRRSVGDRQPGGAPRQRAAGAAVDRGGTGRCGRRRAVDARATAPPRGAPRAGAADVADPVQVCHQALVPAG